MIILLIFIRSIFTREQDVLKFVQVKLFNKTNQDNSKKYDISVACVICKFVVQQADKHIDVSRDCPEISELEMAKARKFLAQRDPEFMKKYELFKHLKSHQDAEQLKPFQYNDDMYYYLVHPQHINNYVDIVDHDDPPPPGPNNPDDPQNPPGGPDDGLSKEKKLIVYHELNDKKKDNNFASEILIKHQYQMKQQPQSGYDLHLSSFRQEDNGYQNPQIVDQLSQSQDSSYEIPPFVTKEQGDSKIQNLWEKNKLLLKGMTDSSFLQLGMKLYMKNKNNKKKNFVQKNKIDLINKQSYENKNSIIFLQDLNNDLQNRKIQNQNQKLLNTKSFLQKEYQYEEVELEPGDFVVHKRLPFQVDQRRIDRVFKDRNKFIRYNSGPMQTINQTKPNEFEGNFIIDKNINFGFLEPQSLLIPKDTYEQPQQSQFVGEIQDGTLFKDEYVSPWINRNKENEMNRIEKQQQDVQNMVKTSIQQQDLQASFLQTGMKTLNQNQNSLKYIDFSEVGNKIGFEYERPVKRSMYPTINTDENIFNIMNDDIQRIGYGKALFPPNPDSLLPEDKCCNTYPCYDNSPCPHSPIKDVIQFIKLVIQGLNPLQQMRFKAQELIFKFRGNDKKIFPIQKRFQKRQQKDKQINKNQNKQKNLNKQYSHHKINKISDQNISFLQTGLKINSNSRAWNYNTDTHRRQRRPDDHPDPAWDCMRKNVQNLVRFICEQEVALSYISYCQKLFNKIDILTESWLYHDSTNEICENVKMCPI